MTRETEREKFEAWWREYTKSTKSPLKFEDGYYKFPAANTAWNSWCAALEAKQVEVKMPEPVGKVSAQGWASWSGFVSEGDAIYTESQLRTLLAQHGIKIAD